ncbi:hypothetical protein OH76DRAFT_987104 [Lentinus brumalis]|uniref:Uncharacterized protein n=1 Tax=Lentinus brumalis TaxID=2498619 RepID=A0A371DQ77_9APHY|nr:hypothetical protein OH76DRAFT_987104 [Polyporus brumalis]
MMDRLARTVAFATTLYGLWNLRVCMSEREERVPPCGRQDERGCQQLMAAEVKPGNFRKCVLPATSKYTSTVHARKYYPYLHAAFLQLDQCPQSVLDPLYGNTARCAGVLLTARSSDFRYMLRLG